jgi:hypothetical protein
MRAPEFRIAILAVQSAAAHRYFPERARTHPYNEVSLQWTAYNRRTLEKVTFHIITILLLFGTKDRVRMRSE